MGTRTKRSLILAASVLILVLALGITAVFAQTDDQDAEPEGDVTTPAPFRGFFGRLGHHGFGGMLEGITPKDELLADALDISVEELLAARDEAHAAWLAEMVDAGYLTQEQADLMLACRALQGVIDRDALLAEALGISVSDLQDAREEGQSLSALLEEQDLSIEDFRAAWQAAYEAAVQQAVDDEIITQAQADQILSGEAGMGCCGGASRFGGMRGFGGMHGFHGEGFRGGFHGAGGIRGFGPANGNGLTTGVGL